MARSDNYRRDTGFTMVELIAVLIIVGILSATLAPRFFSVNVFRERGFFDETLSALRYAQKLAIAIGCPVTVDLTGDAYDVQQPPNADCSGGLGPVINPGELRAPYQAGAPSGITVSAVPVSTFQFDALGRALSAGTPTDVNVTITGDQARTINVIGDTGFVRAP